MHIPEGDFKSFITVKQNLASQSIRHCMSRLGIINRWFADKELNKENVELFYMELKAKGELEMLNAENDRLIEAMRQENENMRLNKTLAVELVKTDKQNDVKTSIASMQAHLQAVSRMLSTKQTTNTVQ